MRRDCRGEFPGFGERLAGGDDSIDEAEALGLVGAVERPGQRHLHRVFARNRAAHEAWAQAAKRLDASARSGLTDPIDDKVKAAIVAALGAAKSDFIREGAKLAASPREVAAQAPSPPKA